MAKSNKGKIGITVFHQCRIPISVLASSIEGMEFDSEGDNCYIVGSDDKVTFDNGCIVFTRADE
jgi:hypothetical protein